METIQARSVLGVVAATAIIGLAGCSTSQPMTVASYYGPGIKIDDPATRKWKWRGVTQARIQDSDPPEVRKVRLETAIRRLMEQFPAKTSETGRP